MTKRRRDYRAEYARRIERGRTKGLSRSQARGHPGSRERLASQPAQAPRLAGRLQLVVTGSKAGKSVVLKYPSASATENSKRQTTQLPCDATSADFSGRTICWDNGQNITYLPNEKVTGTSGEGTWAVIGAGS